MLLQIYCFITLKLNIKQFADSRRTATIETLIKNDYQYES